MNFLITGAAGFLGASLANSLVRDGHQVRGLDDLSTGDPQAIDKSVHFTRGDVSDRPKLWTLLQNVDCVYHLAARVSVPESILYPREYNTVNVGGTVSLMEAMRDVGVRRVVFISSGAIYGKQVRQPLKETVRPFPDSPYAVSKLSSETYVRTIGELWGIETVSLRVFNAYGPGQNLPPSHPPVIPNFIKQSVRNGSIIIHSSGEQTRDYVYVDDVVRAMVAAATAPSIDGEVINVGSGTETNVRDLARLIVEITGSSAEIIYNPRASSGIDRMCADLSLAGEKLGYSPRSMLEEGLQLTIRQDTRFSNA
ncbi:MAG: NAD-dependent epimerase/dehydratase family protein [Anaerolineae bacterium]|nr:NAD-dependent epimerase/dehydratase family protein [Anaerolineae bacterium]MBL6965915.1 NAD-dependent epimerase/dehydratase family protein [Anaerolineales bacterium]